MTYLLGGGVAAGLVILLVVVMSGQPTVAGRVESVDRPSGGPSTPTPAPLPTSAPGHGVTEPIATAVPRLTAALERALLRAVPGADLLAREALLDIAYHADQEFPVLSHSGIYGRTMSKYSGGVDVRWHGRESQVYLAIGWGRKITFRCPDNARDCRVYDRAGQRMMSDLRGYEGRVLVGNSSMSIEDRLKADGYLDTTVSFYVWVDRGDGSYVFVASHPVEPDDSIPSRIPTVDLAMLERIALDPGLTVHP